MCLFFISSFSPFLLWYSINDSKKEEKKHSSKTFNQYDWPFALLSICWSVSYSANFYIPRNFFLSNKQQEIANSAKKHTNTHTRTKQHIDSVKSVQSFNTNTQSCYALQNIHWLMKWAKKKDKIVPENVQDAIMQTKYAGRKNKVYLP